MRTAPAGGAGTGCTPDRTGCRFRRAGSVQRRTGPRSARTGAACCGGRTPGSPGPARRPGAAVRHGAIAGLAATGGVITSAGFVLAGTFPVLATIPSTTLTEMGFAVAFGILLDTIVVRSVLVTALNLDLGRWMWWPSRLARTPDPAPAELGQERAAALVAAGRPSNPRIGGPHRVRAAGDAVHQSRRP